MTETVKLCDFPNLIEFLKTQKALTMANPIDKAGTVHASAMLYYCTVKPLKFYIITDKDTEKCKLLKTQKSIQCAVVVGTEKGTTFSIQMRGEYKQVDYLKKKDIIEKYYDKLHNRYDDINDSKNILLEYTPNWARFTDYSKGYVRYFLKLSEQ